MSRDEEREKPESATGEATPPCLEQPQISLLGEVDAKMIQSFLEQLGDAPEDDPVIAIEISTLGGDAELARRLVLEVGLARKRLGRRLVFLGKTSVYSAGVTLMSAFPRADRYLTRDAMLLIHSRQLDKSIEVSGPMRASLPKLRAACAQVELGIKLEEDNFRRLIEGSDIGFKELCEKALHNWYVPADEALKRGLVTKLV